MRCTAASSENTLCVLSSWAAVRNCSTVAPIKDQSIALAVIVITVIMSYLIVSGVGLSQPHHAMITVIVCRCQHFETPQNVITVIEFD